MRRIYPCGMVTNAKSVGGFKNLPGQDVRLDDGLFEVTLIKRPKNPLELNEIIASLLMQEDHTDLIDSFKTDRIIIESNQEISWTPGRRIRRRSRLCLHRSAQTCHGTGSEQ